MEHVGEPANVRVPGYEPLAVVPARRAIAFALTRRVADGTTFALR